MCRAVTGQRQFVLSLRYGHILDRGALLTLLTGTPAWASAARRDADAPAPQAPAGGAAAGAAPGGGGDAGASGAG